MVKDKKKDNKAKSRKERLLNLLLIKIPMTVVFLGMFSVITIVVVGIIQHKENHKAYLAERANGLETTALVVDKNVRSSGKYHQYYVTLFSEKESFEKQILRDKYDLLTEGDFIEVVLKDKEIYLGNKQDKEEAVHVVDN